VEKASEEELVKWEIDNQGSLKKLAWLLGELREVAKRSEGSAVLVVMGKGSMMEVFEVERKVGAVPGEIVEKSWDSAV
jgi:hypothetical protein